MLVSGLKSWYQTYSGSFWSVIRTSLFIEPQSQQSLWLLVFSLVDLPSRKAKFRSEAKKTLKDYPCTCVELHREDLDG